MSVLCINETFLQLFGLGGMFICFTVLCAQHMINGCKVNLKSNILCFEFSRNVFMKPMLGLNRARVPSGCPADCR